MTYVITFSEGLKYKNKNLKINYQKNIRDLGQQPVRLKNNLSFFEGSRTNGLVNEKNETTEVM